MTRVLVPVQYTFHADRLSSSLTSAVIHLSSSMTVDARPRYLYKSSFAAGPGDILGKFRFTLDLGNDRHYF